jgi:exodeoxyribonuclease VIII
MYDSIAALNYSGAKQILRSPAHYQNWLKAERKETPALIIGRLVHTAILMPTEFNTKVHELPECDRRTKEGKAIYEQFVASVGKDDDVITAEQMVTITSIANAGNAALATLGLQGEPYTKVESSITKPYRDTVIKGRPDLVTIDKDGKTVVVDFKTTMDASPRSFARDIFNYEYHIQNAFYNELNNSSRFIFIAIEKEPPFNYAIYELDAESVNEGKRRMDIACDLYRDCQKFGAWPGYDKSVQSLSLPRYAFSQNQE